MSAPKPAKPASPRALIEILLSGLSGGVLGRLSAQTPEIANLLVTPLSIHAQNFNADVNAFIADEHLWSGNQLFDLVLALAAKGTIQWDLLAHRSPPGSLSAEREI
jgi:hypothetical protein